MSNLAIKVKGLGKKYFIGGKKKNDNRFGEILVDYALAPFRRVSKMVLGRSSGASDIDRTFWALKDLSFEINHGEIVGIVGQNGAGKSTLLKILSRITEPTQGYADVFGRISSLLEVGTGFHPELTGRENVYLNGAILGMRRKEIDRKFDGIVDFAEIEQFINTPVKHYSSGMYVRLAFSVAAHLEPEILLVDEVLAVGDIAFQKKCLGKMDDVSQQGRTILFVSHNMNALQRLCPRSILLNNGKLIADGNTSLIIEKYLTSVSTRTVGPNSIIELTKHSRSGTGKVRFDSITYTSLNPSYGFHPFTSGPLQLKVMVWSDSDRSLGSLAISFYDRYGTKLVNLDTLSLGNMIPLRKGDNKIILEIDKLYLNPGFYTIGLYAADPPQEVHDQIASAMILEVVEIEKEHIRVQDDGYVPVIFKLGQE